MLSTMRAVGGVLCLFLLAAGGVKAGEVTISVKDSAGAAVEDAVVMLKLADGGMPSLAGQTEPAAVKIRQRSRKYVPNVTVVRKGASVSFVNDDPYGHHVYSFSRTKRFELNNPSGEESGPILLDKSGVVPLGCNIHDQMLAYLYVSETPLFGRTDAEGVTVIPGAPPGNYIAFAWHPNARTKSSETETPVTVAESGGAGSISLDVRKPRNRGKRPGFGGSRYK